MVLRPELFGPGIVPTVEQALLAAPVLTGLSRERLRGQHGAGQVVDVDGRPVELAAPVRQAMPVYLYRDLPDEFEVPFDVEILHADERLVVVDKPHFLATMPRGRHVTQTALVRLRRTFGDQLAPAHRLDRLTAGVLLFTRRPQDRAAYQSLFADRLARKEYRALAAAPPTSAALAAGEPVRVQNRIEKTAGDLRARVVDGPANAISDITLADLRPDGLAHYHLVPHTGRTHQLRLHMAGFGVPITGDPLYPQVDPVLAAAPDRGDFAEPLRLIAARLEFDDPLTGARRRFDSPRTFGP
ncbi:putative pseudouridine synthase [Gordonia hirsuta DSM 44140 = NBRC 16056]|uniref:RNA pseudouridylate synthase n=1 Tax=Gordonia hirsuta DSM 44140 = NBRC 16056 TaxID=1121927 RepID=L7LB54_9ACTN|nr:pseudouridine synthase [Gordonia hirsuta]GAC58144.1 putative pseudouridine synthase [Gordonia hirsuta DSM 44140 = NBRC 16056]